jgi:hypothetical protein
VGLAVGEERLHVLLGFSAPIGRIRIDRGARVCFVGGHLSAQPFRVVVRSAEDLVRAPTCVLLDLVRRRLGRGQHAGHAVADVWVIAVRAPSARLHLGRWTIVVGDFAHFPSSSHSLTLGVLIALCRLLCKRTGVRDQLLGCVQAERSCA